MHLYPKVFEEYAKTEEKFGDVSVLDTPTFLIRLKLGEEIEVEIEKGKTFMIKLVSIGEPQQDGTRVMYFELNGQPREVVIQDMTVEVDGSIAKKQIHQTKSNWCNNARYGFKSCCIKRSKVKRGDHLLITEAMKMETTVQAPKDGIVKEIYAAAGEQFQQVIY